MKAKLKKDIIIPAGTEFNDAPSKTERFGAGHIDCNIGLTPDVTANLSVCIGGPGAAERDDAKEWFDVVQDESPAPAPTASDVSEDRSYSKSEENKSGKTIREWLEELPGELGRRARANMTMHAKKSERIIPELCWALDCAFKPEDTPEGCDFWKAVFWALRSLPSLDGLPPMRKIGE